MRSRLSKLRRAGKTVIAMVTDLASDSRDAFVGIDNRAAGQAAAFIVGRSLGDRPTSVGVVLGDYAFRCHQDREIGFRSTLRDRFPKVVLAAEAHGEDNPDRTYEETLGMLQAASGDQRHLQCQRRQCGTCPRRQGSGQGGRHHDHFP